MSRFHVQVLREAEIDVLEAVRYYDKQAIGLGDRFIDEFELAIERVLAFWASEIKYATVRKRRLNFFPYSLHFRVYEDKRLIIVEAVLHEKQLPRE